MPVSSDRSPWIVGQISPSASFRLFCFPHAGLGASAYRSWAGGLGPGVDICAIQLPGRESRYSEQPFRKMDPLADAASVALRPFLDVPCAFFGHSMGALVAFEVALRLAEDRPRHLFVSARRAPHLREPLPPIAHLAQEAFTAAVQQRYGGIPDAVLACDDLLELLIPRLRADFELLEQYRGSSRPRIPCPISVFGGIHDSIPEPDLRAWERYTDRGVSLRMLNAGHLYLQDLRGSLLAALAEDLAPYRQPTEASA